MKQKNNIGIWGLVVKVGSKFGATIVKLAKGLKIGKVGLAGASLASYSYMFTWEFAVLIMISLFVHESGHVWAGIPPAPTPGGPR